MSTHASRRQFLQAAMLATVIGLPMASIAPAGKPGGDGVPPGRVYYRWQSEIYAEGGPYEFRGYWSMNADGSGKTLLPYWPALYPYAHLSYQVHQGHRWFLELRSSPNFAEKVALFAVRDDGDPDFVVLLVDDPLLRFNLTRWAQDDSFISFTARDDLEGPNLDHIYAAEVSFDSDTGLPYLTSAWFPVADGEQSGFPDIRAYDWSPDGTQVVYQQQPNGGNASLLISDLVTGGTRVLTADGWFPVWSPDGSRIAFKPFDQGVHVIRPDGTDLLRLTTGWDEPVGWSPDSQHIAFSRGGFLKGNVTAYTADILRVSATGGSAVNLTKDIDGYVDPHGWR